MVCPKIISQTNVITEVSSLCLKFTKPYTVCSYYEVRDKIGFKNVSLAVCPNPILEVSSELMVYS
jgi:hypothetical protein